MKVPPCPCAKLFRAVFTSLLLFTSFNSLFAQTPATGLSFDGVDDFVMVPDNNAVNFADQNFTIECWVMKLTNNSYYSNSIVAGKWYDDISTWGGEWLLATSVGPNDDNPAFKLVSTDYTTYTVYSYTPLNINTWYHLAAVRDGDNLKLYVNGALQATTTLPPNTVMNSFSDNMCIGSNSYNAGSHIYSNMQIDEFRIWNRALCADEIQHNMTGELNATGQTGLTALYGFNQGNTGSNNSAVTTLTDASGNGNNGTLYNFALNGSTSNWAAGKATGTPSPYTPSGTSTGGFCQYALVQSPGTNYQDANCNLIAKVIPSGASPLSGMVNTCVNWGSYYSYIFYNNRPYVSKHYDIEPDNNASTATATLTLAFTQAEFNYFNWYGQGGTGYTTLPTGPADATGIAQLRITQFHGTGTDPGSYSDGTSVEIDPADANIVWNATLSRWEITFNVTGFSGFYVSSSAIALPIKLAAFTGSRTNGANLLTWTTSEESNTDHFELERNTGSGFAKIGSVKAKGNSILDTKYTFQDAHPADGNNQYRLKSVDIDGRYEYSKIITLKSDGTTSISLYPNPAQNNLFVDGAANGATYQVKNYSGQVLLTGRLTNTNSINVNTLTSGIYVLTVDGQPFKFFKK